MENFFINTMNINKIYQIKLKKDYLKLPKIIMIFLLGFLTKLQVKNLNLIKKYIYKNNNKSQKKKNKNNQKKKKKFKKTHKLINMKIKID